jgi:hypothetical protein
MADMHVVPAPLYSCLPDARGDVLPTDGTGFVLCCLTGRPASAGGAQAT